MHKITHSFWSRASVLALGTGAFLAGVPAAAQSADDSTAVGGLVITAERRTQDMQTAPISATVLNERMLEDKGVVNLTTLQYAAPGVQISDYSSANTFNIRGIGQSQVDIDLPSGVVIYRDGVPTLTGYFQNAPYYDMAGVEVLRGPQGTFAGKSAAAGAVFIRTNDPSLNGFSGSLQGGLGNYDFFEMTGIVNIPITDTLAFRAAFHRETRSSLFDSLTSNPLPGNDNAGGPLQGDDNRDLDSLRLGLLWAPTNNFTATWKLDLDDLDFGSHATSGFCVLGVSEPGLCSDFTPGVEEPISDPVVTGPHGYTDRGARSSLRLAYEFDNGVQLNSLTGYATVTTTANWDSNGSNPNPSAFLSHGDFMNWSQEVNLLSPDDQRFRWTVGAFWQSYLNHIPDHTQNGFELNVADDPPTLLSTPWEKDEIWYAVFGQVEFDLTERLEMQLGARWGHYEFDQFTQLILFEDPNIPFLEPVGGVRQSFEQDSTDWKVALNYQATEDHFVYGIISRGHTPGSINIFPSPFTPVTGEHTPYEEMEVINYEIGWKGAFFNRQLQTQLNIYYQTFEGYQANFSLQTPGIPAIDTVGEFKNAQTESVIQGIEFGAQGYFGNWVFDAGFAYSESELGSFGIVQDIFAPVYGGPANIELDGASTPFAPEWTGNFGVGYTFNVSNSQLSEPMRVTPRIDVAYRGDSYANLFQNRATLLEGQTLLNASLRIDAGDWDIMFWGSNLTDERYAAAKQNVTGVNGFIEGIVYMAPPRLFGVRVGRSF